MLGNEMRRCGKFLYMLFIALGIVILFYACRLIDEFTVPKVILIGIGAFVYAAISEITIYTFETLATILEYAEKADKKLDIILNTKVDKVNVPVTEETTKPVINLCSDWETIEAYD